MKDSDEGMAGMPKSGDAFQVSMFDSLPELEQPKSKGLDETSAPAKAAGTSSPIPLLASDAAFTLENFLPYRILQVAQGVSRDISRVLHEEWDLSLAEWQVLASLARESEVSVREIEPRTLLDTVAVSRAAKRLTDRKLIKREVNKRDKRLVVLKTTKKGRDVAAQIGQRVMTLEVDFLKGMHLQDRIRLSQLLKSLR